MPEEQPGDDTTGKAQTAQAARAAVDAVYRAESRRVLAKLIRLLGDFDLAEEALGLAGMPSFGHCRVPRKPSAWAA